MLSPTKTKTADSNSKHCPKYGLHSHMVSSEFREPFIDKGYRCENMSYADCVKTMFVFKCNETFNIWTHLLPFILFGVKFYVLFTRDLSLDDTFYWPLAANAAGILGFCITSSLAHMFCALSLKARHTCFYADYAAISIYGVTAWQSTYFYSRSNSNDYGSLIGSPRVLMVVCFAISVICTVQSCLTRHIISSFKHALRVSSFVFPWLFAAGPYIYRMLTCDNAFDCESVAVSKFVVHGLLYLTGAVFTATKYPERLFPGSFDWIGQSHQIMHLCTAFGADLQFDSIKMDSMKREEGMRLEGINIEFSVDCLWLTVVAISVNLLVALFFNFVVENFVMKRTNEKED